MAKEGRLWQPRESRDKFLGEKVLSRCTQRRKKRKKNERMGGAETLNIRSLRQEKRKERKNPFF